MSSTIPTIRLSLISHTNAGKTTLARTLLREPIGEVRDQAHVTEESSSHTLIETERARLILWDTPGFGDTARLMKRLRSEKQPIGWLLHQVWDRIADRALFSSQRAVRSVQEDTDVVLYLVNAAEQPEEAGYIQPELELLQWMGRPVLMLLNQVGRDGQPLVARWRSVFDAYPIVRDVLPLDAFTRCWVQEGTMLRSVELLLPDELREPMHSVVDAWQRKNRADFRSSCEAMARFVVETAVDCEQASEPQAGGSLQRLTASLRWNLLDQSRARAALNRRIVERTSRLMKGLIELHGLTGASAGTIEQTIEDFEMNGGLPLDEKSGAIAGGVLSGILGGLAADVMSGGLSLGGGAIAGGILGALGGSALAKGYRLIRGDRVPAVRWTYEFLDRLTGQVLLRYLAVAHFGRGRGDYEELEHPAHWKQAVSTVSIARQSALHRIWEDLESEPNANAGEAAMVEWIEHSLESILSDAYPDARY